MYDEGLHSYKAIAFISSNPKRTSINNNLLVVTLKEKILTNKKTNRTLSKLGEIYG
jgi:hypothetical protein